MSDTPHPGTYVQAWLRENHKNQAYLAAAMQFQEPFISKIVHGRAHVSPKIALRLEAVTRVPATTWLRYETDYLLARERQRAN